jgi:hypothetical protein
MRDEDSYQPGEEAFYHDTGEVDRVEVLENGCDSEWINYRLRVLEVVKKSSIVKPSEIGEEFDFKKQRNCQGCSGLGHLMDY